MSAFNFVRIVNCLQTAEKKIAVIETLKGEEKFKNYASFFRNALAINLNLFKEPQRIIEPKIAPEIIKENDQIPEKVEKTN